MHWFYSESRKKPKRNQIQVSVKETIQTTKLRFTEFTCLMLYHLLADSLKSGIFSQIRDITVHFAVYFDILHYGLAIGFQATIEVV